MSHHAVDLLRKYAEIINEAQQPQQLDEGITDTLKPVAQKLGKWLMSKIDPETASGALILNETKKPKNITEHQWIGYFITSNIVATYKITALVAYAYYQKLSEVVKKRTSTDSLKQRTNTIDTIRDEMQVRKAELQFYEINLPSVDTADSYIPVTDYDSKRIITDHILQDFATLTPNAVYTNADLVLSIFIALKEKRTK